MKGRRSCGGGWAAGSGSPTCTSWKRKAGTAPRVTPVSLILTQGKEGRALDGRPFQLNEVPAVDGVPLPELARIRLAPWLGPDGIFLVDAATRDRLPAEYLFPAVEPGDIGRDDVIRETRRWVIRTTRGEPPAPVLAHLDSTLGRMPKGGRRVPRWLPPEPFAGKLPVDQDAVLVPRIATHLRAIRLPAGVIPANHQLVVVSGLPVPVMIAMLTDAAVQAQADALGGRRLPGLHGEDASPAGHPPRSGRGCCLTRAATRTSVYTLIY
jgi:hypothetical protein